MLSSVKWLMCAEFVRGDMSWYVLSSVMAVVMNWYHMVWRGVRCEVNWGKRSLCELWWCHAICCLCGLSLCAMRWADAICCEFGFMMTSSNGNIFRVTGPLWGVFTGHKGQWHGALMLSLICAWTNGCRWGSLHFATAHWGQLTEGCSLGAAEMMPSATSCGQLKNQCHLKVHSMGVGGGVLVAKHLNKCQMTEILWILYSWFSYFEQVLLIPI